MPYLNPQRSQFHVPFFWNHNIFFLNYDFALYGKGQDRTEGALTSEQKMNFILFLHFVFMMTI